MEYIAEEIFDHIDKFKMIWADNGNDEINPIPKNARVTIYVKSNNCDIEGFIEDTSYKDAGIDLLIAKSWILQSELDVLIGRA